MKDLNSLKFERNIWADKRLAKLCPGNDVNKLTTLLNNPDFTKTMDSIMDIIIILNEAYEQHEHFKDSSHEIDVVTREDLQWCTEAELIDLCSKAMGDFKKDSETTINAEPKKEEADLTKSI